MSLPTRLATSQVSRDLFVRSRMGVSREQDSLGLPPVSEALAGAGEAGWRAGSMSASMACEKSSIQDSMITN
jgi:hypothetical protein